MDGADIVVTTVTLIPEPVSFLDARWTMPGFDRIVVDDLEQEAKMSKPMIKSELVAGDERSHLR